MGYKKWSRVPIYPRDILGELYRGEWRDVLARPMWASVEFLKSTLKAPIKRLPESMIGDGPGKDAFDIPGPPAKTPLLLNPFAAQAPGLLPVLLAPPGCLPGSSAPLPSGAGRSPASARR